MPVTGNHVRFSGKGEQFALDGSHQFVVISAVQVCPAYTAGKEGIPAQEKIVFGRIIADAAGRMAEPEVKEILAKMLPCEEEMCKAERMYREGILPKRICHCDTKVNNMMFDAEGNILCVIDLDTLMPSFVFSDFGDFLRTAANTVAEDDPAWEKVDFKMDIFEAFAKGYLEGATFLTPVEKDNLPFAACLFPYMQAVRFFTDYINGDTYYKIKYPDHNLVRTRNQWALFEAARRKVPQMKAFIEARG